MASVKKVMTIANKKALAIDKTKTPPKKDKMVKSNMSKVNKATKKTNKNC